MRIEFENHGEYQGMEELLRLFYDDVTCRDDGSVAATAAGTEKTPDLTILSALSRPLSKAELRGEKRSEAVIVTTTATKAGNRRMREPVDFLQAAVPAASARRELKRQLYILLERLEDLSWPWGSLTGIRPTQICAELLRACGGRQEAAMKLLCEAWRLSEEKAVKGLETAVAEQEILNALDKEKAMVYLGIPFCPGRCSYCSFISRDAGRQSRFLPAYTEALVRECRDVFAELRRPVSALYLGGGTPTSLCDDDFARVLDAVRRYVPLADHAEITVEAGRPDTITATKLKILREYGVERICINPQSMKDETLQRIGRHHSRAETLAAYRLAREFGFDHINMDLILGLPGETGEDFLQSVDEILRLAPESVTLHALALKRSARLEEEERLRYQSLRYPNARLSECLAEAEARLRREGYRPYYLYRQKNVRGGLENTGFARDGKNCLYNVGMMSDEISVIGLGSGASSKLVEGRRVRRLHNSKDLLDYIERVDELVGKKIAAFEAFRA